MMTTAELSKMTTSTLYLPHKETLGAVEPLLAATIYLGNRDTALEYRINWEIYTSYAGAAGMWLHTSGKFTMGNGNNLFWRNI